LDRLVTFFAGLLGNTSNSCKLDCNIVIMLWGSSPCLDLAAYDEVGEGHLNILIVSAGDTRHLLQTLAKRYKHSYTKISIYVYEPVVDMYARQIQQIALALEPIDRVSLSYKVFNYFFVRDFIKIKRKNKITINTINTL